MKFLRFFAIALTLLATASAKADDWKSYISYHNVTRNLPVADKVYALGRGGLFTYTYGDTKVRTYSKSTGLSSTNITQMAYCEELKEMLLVYEDYNIDIVTLTDSIINIPQYKNASFTDKTINDITICGHNAYIATNFGVIVINLKKAEFSNAYNLGMSVRSAVCDEDYIYAIGPDGIYAGSCEKNLLDRTNWQRKSTAWLSRFIPYNGEFYGYTSNALYKFNPEDCSANIIYRCNIVKYSSYGNDLVLLNPNQVVVMNDKEEFKAVDYANDFYYLTSDGKYLWAARNANGLQAYAIDTDSLGTTTLSAKTQGIVPNSPVRNYFNHISYTDNDRLLVAGGALAYNGQTTFEGTAMAFENGKWINFAEDSVAEKTGVVYRNLCSLVQDPKDPNHHFATSAVSGLYEYRNMKVANFYNCDNSPITSIYPTNQKLRLTSIHLTGAKYDPKGNLWFFNNQVDTIVRLITPEGKWKSFYIEEIKGFPTFDDYLFDSRGWVWMSHRRWAGTFNAGIACLNYNGTLDNPRDDKFAMCTNFVNQNGVSATISLLNAITFDRNGQMWIGTSQGVYILEDPSKFFAGNVTFRQPLIPRNDGTNYADYLLDGVDVKAIAVDGANRKWLGTSNNGLYLVAEDGLKVLEHFTTDNSPLLSNSILSLAINPNNGLVMIGTDKGLVSYRGDATEPESKLKESNIKIFPNPVKPDYHGKIRITGFTADSDVKITSATGMVIAQGKSLGGSYIWNGCDKSGNRVATGVYYVVGADSEGKSGVVGKILVVR